MHTWIKGGRAGNRVAVNPSIKFQKGGPTSAGGEAPRTRVSAYRLRDFGGAFRGAKLLFSGLRKGRGSGNT